MAKEMNLYRLHRDAPPVMTPPTPPPDNAPPVVPSPERPVRARFAGREDPGEAAYTLDMQRLGARITTQRLQGGS
jgi:hypothetical protein